MRKITVLLLALGILVAGCIEDSDGTSEVDYHGLEYEPPLAAADFTLTDQNSNEVSFSDFSGKVVIVAFTYTHCPDVCLVIEGNLDYVKSQLGDGSSQVAFISISTDPARDTPTHLLEWTVERGYDWPHLTSENHTLLQETWNSWGIAVANDHLDGDDHHSDNETEGEHSEEDGTAEEYTVGHNTVTYIIDRAGNKKIAYVGADWSATEFLEDVQTLVSE